MPWRAVRKFVRLCVAGGREVNCEVASTLITGLRYEKLLALSRQSRNQLKAPKVLCLRDLKG